LSFSLSNHKQSIPFENHYFGYYWSKTEVYMYHLNCCIHTQKIKTITCFLFVYKHCIVLTFQ
jgi:hypothetical protein